MTVQTELKTVTNLKPVHNNSKELISDIIRLCFLGKCYNNYAKKYTDIDYRYESHSEDSEDILVNMSLFELIDKFSEIIDEGKNEYLRLSDLIDETTDTSEQDGISEELSEHIDTIVCSIPILNNMHDSDKQNFEEMIVEYYYSK
jgi:hypothetical protein